MTARELIKQLLTLPDIDKALIIYINGDAVPDCGYDADIDFIDVSDNSIVINIDRN